MPSHSLSLRGKYGAACAHSCTAARTELTEYLQLLTHQELLDLVRVLPVEALRQWQAACGLVDCRCPVKVIKCGCDTSDCDCPVRTEPCRRGCVPERYTLPLDVLAELLARLDPDEYGEPAGPAKASRALSQEALAAVRARRARKGEGLWHPGDLTHRASSRSSQPDQLDQVVDRVAREAYRNRNGSVGVGRPEKVRAVNARRRARMTAEEREAIKRRTKLGPEPNRPPDGKLLLPRTNQRVPGTAQIQYEG